MALYRFEIKVHSRRHGTASKTRPEYRAGSRVRHKDSSLVATAAYRSGEALKDTASGLTHDFRRKGGVEHAEILAPAGAPPWASDRATLWNAVEAAEKRVDARLAREAIITLPRELSTAQRIRLVRSFVREQFVARGMIADVAVHCPNASDERDQPHAHVLLTTRTITPEGWGPKDAGWNRKELLLQWRQAWEDACNAALSEAGREERVDRRSYKDQGVDRRPGKPHGLAKRLKLPNARMKARVEHNREVGLLNEAIRTGLWIGNAALTGSVPGLVGQAIGEVVGHEAARAARPVLRAVEHALHPGPPRE